MHCRGQACGPLVVSLGCATLGVVLMDRAVQQLAMLPFRVSGVEGGQYFLSNAACDPSRAGSLRRAAGSLVVAGREALLQRAGLQVRRARTECFGVCFGALDVAVLWNNASGAFVQPLDDVRALYCVAHPGWATNNLSSSNNSVSVESPCRSRFS